MDTALAQVPGAEVGQPQETARASTGDPAGVRAVQQGDPADAQAVRPGDPVGAPVARHSDPVARQSDPVAAESLLRIHWPAALAQSATHVGWDTTSVAPPEVVRQLVHAMTFAGFRAAANEGWLPAAAQDLGDRLRERTGDALLDGMGQLNTAERNTVAEVLRAPSGEQQPTEHQIDVLEQLIRAVHALYRADESPETGVQVSNVIRSSAASAGDPTVTPLPEAADPGGTTTPELLVAADSAVRAAGAAVSASGPVQGRAEETAASAGDLGARTAPVAVPKPDPNSTRDLRALRLGVVAAYKKLEGATDADPVVAALAASPLELFGRFVDQLYPSQRTALALRFRQGLTEDQVAYVHNGRATTEPHWTATTVGALAAGGLRRLARTIAAEQGIPGSDRPLTSTELAVLEATARGLSRAVIARRLDLPQRALAAVTRQTAQKLGVGNRAASVAEAVRRGELDPTVFPAPGGQAVVGLSERETAVLVLTAKGLTPVAVAAALSVSPTDVHTRLGDIGRALGTHIPAAMVAAGIRSGVLEVNGTRWSQWDRTDGETAADAAHSSPPAVVTADGALGTPAPVDPAVLDAPAAAPHDRAGAGDGSVAQALNRRYGRDNVGRIVAMLGWDPARGTPPTQLVRLAHAIHFRAVAFAGDDRRPVPAGRPVADWLFEVAQNTVLECLGGVTVQDRRTIGAAINGLHRGDDPTEEQLAAIQRLAAAAQRRADPGGPEDRADTTAGRITVSPAPKPFVGTDSVYAEPGVAAPVGGFDPALVTAVDPGAPIGSHTVIGRGGSGNRTTGVAATPRTGDGPTSPVSGDRALSEAVAHIVWLVGGLAPATGMAPARILAALLGLTAAQAAGILLRVNSALAETTDVPAEASKQQALLTRMLQLSPTQVEILRLLAEVLPGGTGRPTTVPPDLLRAFRDHIANLPGAALGRQEIEVLHLFMLGHSVESAAAAMDLPPDTVSGYFTSAEHGLGSRGVIPTILAALRAGVLDNDNTPYEAVELSEIEVQALRAVAAGVTDDVIGTELGLGTRRRRRLMAELYDKFGVDSKLELALAAHRHRLLEEADPGPGSERAPRKAEVSPSDTELEGAPVTSTGTEGVGDSAPDRSTGDEARPPGTTRQAPYPWGYDSIGGSFPGFAEWEHPPSGELGRWTHHISLLAARRAELLHDVRQMARSEGLAELLDLGEWAAAGASPAYLDVGELSDRILDVQTRPGIDSETADSLHALLGLLEAIEQQCQSMDVELTNARIHAEQVAVREVADARGGLRLGRCARIVDSARVEVFEGSGRYSVLPGALYDSLREQSIATVTRRVRVDPTGRVLVEQLPEPVHTAIERRQERLWELCASVGADTGTSNRLPQLPPEWGARIAAVQAGLVRTAAVRARLFPARVDPHRMTAADESRQRRLLARMELLTERLAAFRQEAEAERLTALMFSGAEVLSVAGVTSPISEAANSARATLRADIRARSAVEAARDPELLALLRNALVPRVMADAEDLKWNARPRAELITAVAELTEALEDVNRHQSRLSPPQGGPDTGPSAERPVPPADIDYPVRHPIAPGFYDPVAVRGITTDTIRRPTVAGGLFIGQGGKRYTTNGEEYFLIGADPDDIRTVNYGEVREAMRSLFAPHAVLLSTYADLADGPIIWGYWRITDGVLERTAFTSGTLLNGEADLDVLLKHAAYYRHWLRARDIDPSGIEIAGGTLQGRMWRPQVDGPVPSVRELFEQGGSRARAVFAACGDGFWVSVGAVTESPGHISVPLTINLLSGGTTTFTWEFTRAGDAYTARISDSDPAPGPHTAELATAFATLHARVTAPWLAASEVLVEAPGEGGLWSAGDPNRTNSPGPPKASGGPSGKRLAESTNHDRPWLFGPGDRAPAVSAAEPRPATTPWQSKVQKGTAEAGIASESAPTPWSAGQRDAGSSRLAESSAATDPASPAPAPRRSATTRHDEEQTVPGTALEIPEHVRLCLVQTVRAAWAIGYDDADIPADDAETWKDLTDSLHATPTRVTVPEGTDPRAAVAGILDMLEDPGNAVEAVAFVIDSGTRAHSFLATSEGKGRTLIFDTTIRAPRGGSDDGQPVRRMPRVRDRDTWERDFPGTFPDIEDLFSLDFVRDGGRLRPEPDTDRAGPTDEQRRHLIHGEPGSTPYPAEEPVTTRKLFVVNKPFINLLLGTPTLPGGEVGNKLGSVAASYAVPYALMNAGQSPAVAALAGAGAWLPRLLDPHAGRVADRSDRRKVMLWAQGIGAGAAAAMTGLILFDAPHLGAGVTAATLVEATAAAYYFRAFQAVTGDFLTAAQRPAANDLRNLTGSTAEATGQALGPGLVGMIPAGPFALNLLSYLTNFENVRRLSFPRQTFGEPRSLFRDIGEGARALWQEKFLREYTAIGTLNNAAWAMMGFRTATVLEASDLPGWATGAVVAAPAVGGMMSGVLSKMTRNVEATTFYPVALANMAGFFALQAATTNPAVIASATFADSLLMWALNSRIASYEMGAFPSEIRGRAGGVKGLFLGAGPAAGMFAASALVGGAAANVHSGDALAALAATISAVTAAGYAVVLFVRKGQVFYRIVTRGRGLFGRLARPAETEPARAPAQGPGTELVENCAKFIGRVHRAIGAPARPPAPDHAAAGAVELLRELEFDADRLDAAAGEIIRDLEYETDPRWNDEDNWRITEEVLGAQLRPMKTRGADPVATAVEIIRDGKNRIDRAAVTVDGHIHYIVAVEGLDGRDQILVFDSLVEDATVDDTEIALRVRNADGDENGDNRWQPSYTTYRKAFAAYFTTEGGVAVPVRRNLAGFLPRRHPVELRGRPADAELTPEQIRQLIEQHIGSGNPEEAVRLIRKQYGARIQAWVSANIGDPHAARAITDEACVRAVRRFDQVRNASVEEWVVRTARNLIAEHRGFILFRRQIVDIFVAGADIDPEGSAARALAAADRGRIQDHIRSALTDTQRRKIAGLWSPARTEPLPADRVETEDPVLWGAVRRLARAVAAEHTVAGVPDARAEIPTEPTAAETTPRGEALAIPVLGLEILQLAAEAMLPGEIADALGLPRATVDEHLARAADELDVEGLAATVEAAKRAHLIADDFGRPPRSAPKVRAAPAHRRTQLLELIAAGRTNREIAQILGLTPGTVNVYLHRLENEFGTRTRAELTAAAVRARIIGDRGGSPQDPAKVIAELDQVDRDLIAMTADGLSNRRIAEVLGIHEVSVGRYYRRIRETLGIESNTTLIAMAARYVTTGAATDGSTLSERESRLLGLVASGVPNAGIAKALGIGNVPAVRARIAAKSGVRTLHEMVEMGRRLAGPSRSGYEAMPLSTTSIEPAYDIELVWPEVDARGRFRVTGEQAFRTRKGIVGDPFVLLTDGRWVTADAWHEELLGALLEQGVSLDEIAGFGTWRISGRLQSLDTFFPGFAQWNGDPMNPAQILDALERSRADLSVCEFDVQFGAEHQGLMWRDAAAEMPVGRILDHSGDAYQLLSGYSSAADEAGNRFAFWTDLLVWESSAAGESLTIRVNAARSEPAEATFVLRAEGDSVTAAITALRLGQDRGRAAAAWAVVYNRLTAWLNESGVTWASGGETGPTGDIAATTDLPVPDTVSAQRSELVVRAEPEGLSSPHATAEAGSWLADQLSGWPPEQVGRAYAELTALVADAVENRRGRIQLVAETTGESVRVTLLDTHAAAVPRSASGGIPTRTGLSILPGIAAPLPGVTPLTDNRPSMRSGLELFKRHPNGWSQAVWFELPKSPSSGVSSAPISTREPRLDECLDRTAELITLRARREGDNRPNDWRKLRTDLGARLIDASGPADPLREIIDRVKDPANDIHTTVVLVDDGETMHAFTVTAVGDTAIFFDTTIDHRTNPNLTAADRELAEQTRRIPRVQTESEFRNRFTKITGIFKAEYAEDPATGALEDANRYLPETAEAAIPREGEITGPPRASEHAGEDDGDSGLTGAQAEELRALTDSEHPHGTDGGHRLWLLPDPRGANPEAKVVVRRAIVTDDTDPLAVVGDLLHVIPTVDEGAGAEVSRPRMLYQGGDLIVHEQIAGTPLTMADLVSTDMSFRGDIAEQLFAQQTAGERREMSIAEWETGLRIALRSAEAKIAGLHPGSMLGSGTGLLGLPALSKIFPPNQNAGGDPRPVRLRGTVTLAELVRTPDGTFARQEPARPDLGPPAWAYAAFLIRNPWPPEVRPQVRAWCREQILRQYDRSAAADFDRYVAVEARIAAVGRALQVPRSLAAHSVRNSDLLSEFTADVALVHRAAHLVPPSESDCQSALDLLADRIARGWPSTRGRYLVPEVDEPLPPRLGVPIGQLNAGSDLTTLFHRWQNGAHRLEVHRIEGGLSIEGGLRMHAVAMIGQAEFGDLTISFELDGDGDLVAFVEPGPASEFVAEYRSVRGGADRGSFLDLVRHFVRGAGADVLRIRVADDPGNAVLHGEDLLRQEGFESADDAGQWLSERCAWVPAAAEPVVARLDRRLTPSQVLQVMEQVRVTSPHESENQCGVWHLPLPGALGGDSEPMVTVRVYLEEAQQLGFDLDTTVLSASETSDLFHQAGVGGPRSLYDSETFSFGPNFRTRVTIHEYVSGREVKADEGWERTTEDTFAELYRLHSMTSPMTQRQWDARQQARMIELEQGDIDHRLDQLTGGVPLFVTWKTSLVGDPESRMGYTHGNPIRRKMRRGADGRIGFTDAKLAQYGPIAWDWARYYLVNDWAGDAEREAVAAEIRTILLHRYGADIGPHLVADFHRYLLLEARKSIIGDAYRLPRKIATGLLTVDEALPAFHRNINLVRLAAGQDSMSEDAVRVLLLEWSLRTLMPDHPTAERAEQPAAPAAAPRRWIQHFFPPAHTNFGLEYSERDPTALRFVQRWDGPLRLEPSRVRTVEDMLVVTAVVTRGTRMSEERYFQFMKDDSGRIVADYTGGLSASKVDGLVLDFVRDAGAEILRGYFSDFPGAARAGFDWNRAHIGEMAAVREALLNALDQLERREPVLPAPVAEIQRRLRSGTVPTPHELLDAGLIDLGVDLDRISEAWLLCIDVASARDAVWREPDVTPDRVAPADPAPTPETLFATIEREGAGTMEWEVAARQFLRARLRAPDWQGNNKRVWLFHDENGNRIVVHQLLRAATDDKDLTRNPTSTQRDIRWYHRLAFDVPDAVDLAADATDVPARVYRWRDFYVEEFAEGRTPATTDDDWITTLEGMFEVKRRLSEVTLPDHLRVRPVTEHLYLYLDHQRRNYRGRAPWLDRLFRLAPHQAWSPETDDQAWPPSLSHNDMTLDNVRIADDGTLMLIDWDNAAITHPLWDYVTMLWSNWPSDRVDAVEARIREEVRNRYGPRGEAELERLLLMACLDSLYADSVNFVEQIVKEPGRAETLIARFYSDYRRLCRLRGWQPEEPEVVRALILTAVNGLNAERGLPPLPDSPVVRPSRRAAGSTGPRVAMPPAVHPGDPLLGAANSVVGQDYGPHSYAVVPTDIRSADEPGGRRLTVSATIVVEGARGPEELGDMRFHLRMDDSGDLEMVFDHLEIDTGFAGARFLQYFVPRIRESVGAGGRIVLPVHGPAGFRMAARHGLRMDTDPEHLAESRESTTHLLRADLRGTVADPMLDRFDRPVEARPTFAELARYFGVLPHDWPENRRWWGVLEGAPTGDGPAASDTGPRPMTRMSRRYFTVDDPTLTGQEIDLLTTLVRDRADFAGNHHGVWVIPLPDGRPVVVRVSLDTPNPNFDPRIGLVFGEEAAVALCRRANVRVPQLLHSGAQEAYPERYMIHEFLDGRHPTPQDPLLQTAEAVFGALDRLHALHETDWRDITLEQDPPGSRAEWERRMAREVARIRLEFDEHDRLHGELGLPGLYEVFAVRPAADGDVPLGALHGDPTLGNLIFLGPEGAEQPALLDLELSQPGPAVWDYVAYAGRNSWQSDTDRRAITDWCRERLRRFYGDAAAADFDRYRVLEAWKSVAGDSFRLPLLVARDRAFLDEAARILHRNLAIVFEAAQRPTPTLAQVRNLLSRWAQQPLPGNRAQDPPPVGREPAPTALPLLDLREHLRAGIGNSGAEAAQALRSAVMGLSRADGPARLEPVSAEYEPVGDADPEVRSRIRLRTVVMDGSREYGEATVFFELDRAGRVTARLGEADPDFERLADDYGGPRLLGPAEDLARRMGADTLETVVRGAAAARAARHGFDWSRPGEPGAPGTAGAETEWGSGAIGLFGRRLATKDLTDPSTVVAPIEYRRPARRAQGSALLGDLLRDLTKPLGGRRIQLSEATRILIRAEMRSPDTVGYHALVWCEVDNNGNPVKVRRVVATPGRKDLAANPVHTKLLSDDRRFQRIELDEERAEELARRAGALVPTTLARAGERSFRSMGAGRVPTTTDPDWQQTLRGLFRQLRRLQTVDLPADLVARPLTEYEQLFLSMQRVKYDERQTVLDRLWPMPHEIWIPGESSWKAGLSHGNATFRNLWVRADGEVMLDNWNLAGVRHQLWDYVEIFWNPWPWAAMDRVETMVETEIRDQYGESGVREFRRLRAMAVLDSLYGDSHHFVEKIRRDPRSADTLVRRLYSDYRWLWQYAEDNGLWASRGERPLSYRQVYELMMYAADPSLPLPELLAAGPGTAPRARTAPRPDLSAVPSIPDLLADPPPEHELRAALSGLQQQYGLDLDFELTRVQYLRTGPGGPVSGIRIRGAFVLHRTTPIEAGDLDLSIEFDENGSLTARFDELWIEPWHGVTGCGRDFVPPLRDYLRRSDVEDFTVTVRGRRGAAAAIAHDLDWDYSDRARLGRAMRALGDHIRSRLALTQDEGSLSPALRALLSDLDHESTPRYPTPAEIAHHLPANVDPAEFFTGFHWTGRTTP
ncbi:LuxR C-terminal-related transcriptional regulator [Nocardia testacea]|uniref:LuxR C-terminal-related transcriptional regulator n=1 Tax=Nocardia testacea TaxID=248551 RepID=UPI003C308741